MVKRVLKLAVFVLTVGILAAPIALHTQWAQAAGGGGDVDGLPFLDVPRIAVVVAHPTRGAQLLHLDLVFEASSDADLPEIEAHMPRIVDAYVPVLQDLIADEAVDQVDRMKDSLRRVANLVVGYGAVIDVLIEREYYSMIHYMR